MTNSLIKIVLIGNYSIFRNALRMLIETDKRLRVIGEAARIDMATDMISEEKPDLILVDLPDLGGKELLPFFQNVNIPILMLSGQHDTDIFQECLKIGISGLVLKGECSDALFKAIEKIHGGEMWFDRAMMGKTIRQLINEKKVAREQPASQLDNELTQREKQVVELICQGMKNRGIAEKLFITETTVRHHLTSVFNKLEITSRLELVVYAFKNNLVKPPSLNNGLRFGNGHAQATAATSAA